MDKLKQLALLRSPFPDDQIGELPRGGLMLKFVGHAAATSRLLDVDPEWTWEPMATDEHGLPMLDRDNLLWIRLTVCGVTRVGCGDAGNKKGGDAMKERIGDAIRSASMRFGLALDLWHKGDMPLYEEDLDYTPAQKAYFDSLIAGKDSIELFVLSKTIPQSTYEALFSSFDQGQKTAKKAEVRKLVESGGAIAADWITSIETAKGDAVLVTELVASNKKFVVEYLQKELNPEAQQFFSEVVGAQTTV